MFSSQEICLINNIFYFEENILIFKDDQMDMNDKQEIEKKQNF